MMPVSALDYDRPLVAHLWDHVQRTPDATALWIAPEGTYRSLSWSEIAVEVARAVAAFSHMGVLAGDRVVHWSENRYEWLVTDLALQALRAVHVPLHSTLTASQTAEQIEHAEPALTLVSSAKMLRELRSTSYAGLRSLRIATYEPHRGVPVFSELAAQADPGQGMELVEHERDRHDPQAIATILYSSGTGGAPKAVALTHANLANNALAVIQTLDELPTDRRLCFLPLIHIYARTCDFYTWLARGSQLALARDRDTVIEDCRAVQPTLMNGVPYFYDRIAHRVAESAKSANPITLQQILGTSLRACFCGGAALSPSTYLFFHERGLPLLPGYGLTETSPVVALSTPEVCRCGTVGKAIPGVEVRIEPDGELSTRGPHVMAGYWKNESATRDAIQEGWFHTGDLGAIDPDGFISITGRKKELLVMSTGKKVSPTHIEGLLCRDPLILQAMVIGNDRKYLTALIVPDPETLGAEIRKQRLWVLSRRGALRHARVRRIYQDRIREQLSNLAAHEHVQRFMLLDRGFTIEGGQLTPKLSLKRDAISEMFRPQIESLYAGGGIGVHD